MTPLKSNRLKRRKRTKKKIIWGALFVLLLLVPISVSIYQHFKPVPEGISFEGEVHETTSVQFLYDLTYADEFDQVTHEQEIFDYVYKIIEEAEDFLIVDMFLFNDDYDHTDENLEFPTLSADLSSALAEKKAAHPDIEIILITDPINTFYGTYTPPHLAQLEEAGIHIVYTNLDALRDSNPLYSGFYRSYLQWFDTSESAYLPNVFRRQGPQVNVQSYIHLLNFKANHRKTMMNEQEALISSANPHDASFYHSNVAYAVSGEVLEDLLASERAVAEMSGFDTTLFDTFEVKPLEEENEEPYQVQLLTERKIKEHVLEEMERLESGDSIQAGMFYLSDREIVTGLKDASERGVEVQLILDVNQDAFGNEKPGIPNRPVAHELVSDTENIEVRWYESHGEQFHSKFLIFNSEEDVTMIGGSTNYTRRNLDNINLETNIKITGTHEQPEIENMLNYFTRMWENQDGTYTVEYDVHGEDTLWKTLVYRFQEWSGLSTF
jgi:HKD family nuclease